MKRAYTSHDIKKAVEMVEEKGLDQFLDQHPYEKKRGTQTERNSLTGEVKTSEVGPKNIFDFIMFGSHSPKSDLKDSYSDDLTIKETQDYSEGSPTIDDNSITCNPCEEVREIVRGIREGKYRLKTTAYPIAEDTESYHHSKGLRLPEHWVTVNRNNNNRSTDDQQQTFKYHSTYGDDGNMWSFKVGLKK